MENTGDIPRSGSPAPETGSKPEGQEGRKKILNALKLGVDLLRNDIQNTESNTPKKEWILKSVTDAQERSLAEGETYQFTNTFEDFENDAQISQKEGVPVDELISFLREKAKTFPAGSSDRDKLFQAARTLFKNSSPLSDFPYQNEPNRYLGRTRQEAKFISLDYRKTESMEEDWYKAAKALDRRRILVVPPPTSKPQHQAEEIATPVATVAPDEISESKELIKRSAVWKNKDHDEPVVVTGSLGKGPDGREYLSIEGSATGIPADEVELLEPEAEELTPEEEEMRNLVTTHSAETPPPAPEAPSSEPLTDEEKELRNRITTHEAIEEPEIEEDKIEPTATTDKKVITFVRRDSDIRKRAKKLADEAIRNEQRRGNILNPLNWVRKTKFRIMEEMYRQRYIDQISRAMRDGNNSYLTMDVVNNAAIEANHRTNEEREAGTAKIDQLKTGELIHGQEVASAQGELKTALINDIIRPAVENENMDIAQLQERLREFIQNHQDNPQISSLFGPDASQHGRSAEYFATDLLDTAALIRNDYKAHKFALEEFDIMLANSDWATETQERFTAADRFIAWTQRRKMTGIIANPAVVGAAFSIGVYGGLRALGIGGRAAQVAVPLAGLLPGAALAGIRRHHDLNVDRAAHMTEMAYGDEQVPENAKRRRAMEKFSYESSSISALLNGNVDRDAFGDSRGLRELMNLDFSESESGITNREALIRRIAEIKTRLDFSAQESVDLIRFEGEGHVEQGRLHLIQSYIEARQRLYDSGASKAWVSETEARLTGEWRDRFIENRQQQDRAFLRFRLKNAAVSGVFGGVAGFAAGFGLKEVSEGMVNLTGKDISIRGAADGIGKGATEVKKGLNNIPGVDIKTEGDNHSFTKLYKEGGISDTDSLHILADEKHNVTFVDKKTGEIVSQGWQIQENGHITITGQADPRIISELKSEGFLTEITQTDNTLLDTSEGSIVSETLGKPVTIPQGTEWVADTSNPAKFDLVITGRPDQVLVDNASVDASGRLIFENSSGNLSFIANETTIPGETQDVFTDNGAWSKNATAIDGRQWYGNNTPGVSDLNELRAYNSVFTASDGQKGVVWDMSHMQPDGSFQTGNNPESVNVQGVINKSEAVFAFSTHDHQGNPIIIRDISDGVADGKFVLDPSDTIHHINPDDPNSMTVAEFSQLVLNQGALQKIPDGSLASELNNHRDVFTLGRDGKNGFMEAATLSNGNNGKILQVFATAQGNGQAPEQIIGAPKTIFENSFSVNSPIVEKIPGLELIPPTEDGEIPIIPIPFAPRHPLERLTPTKIIPPPLYPYVYNPITGGSLGIDESGRPIRTKRPDGTIVYGIPIKDQDNWLANRSERLKENPQAHLNQQVEIKDYFDRMTKTRRDRIDGLKTQIDQPLNKNTRGIICIPVAAALETENIEGTLSLLAQQSNVTNDQHEIIVYLNWMNDADLEKVRKTQEIVTNFQKTHPDLPLKVVNEELKRDTFTIGDVMKTVNDVGLRRVQDAGIEEDVILTVLPADIKGLSRRFTEGLVKNADGSKDMYTSPIEFGTMYFKDYPGFHITMRALENIIRISEQAYPAPISTAGSGLQKKASILAAVGGYDETKTMGEDADIGFKVVAARLHGKDEYTKDEFPVGRSFLTWNEVDPARLLQPYKNGGTILSAWSDFDEGGYKPRPTNAVNAPESLERDWDSIVARLENQLTTLNATYSPSLTTRAFNLALGYAEKEDNTKTPNWARNPDGTITITADGRVKLKEYLLKYQNDQLYDTRYRQFRKSNKPSRGIKPGMEDAPSIAIEDLPSAPGEDIESPI